MIKNFLKNSKYSISDFEEELFKPEIDTQLLEKMIVQLNIDLNYLDQNNQPLVHKCLKKRMYRSASWLIEKGADTLVKDPKNNDLLDLTIELDKPTIVKQILILKKHNINKLDQDKRSLLQNVVVEGKNEIAKLLIEFGADFNHKDKNSRNVVFDALSYGNEEFIDYLLEINGIELDTVDIEQNSIMHHHEVITNDSLAKKLIQKGVDTTIKDKNGNTFLCSTALRGIQAYELVLEAIKHGADINSRVADEKTILMELITSYSKLSDEEKERRKALFEMAKLTVSEGIDLNGINSDKESALFNAVKTFNIDLVAFLLNQGANPNIQNRYSQTVLNYAIYEGIENLDIILLLLRYGADPLTKNNKNQTIYEILNEIILHTHGNKILEDKFVLSKIKPEGQYIVILKELLNSSSDDLDFKDSKGNPLFFDPLLYNNFQLFKLYIKNGLNIHNTNKYGHNILFEYILKVFKDNEENPEFQNNISMILSKKVEHNIQDNDGNTILHKILSTPCDRNLFYTLTDTILFNYELTDKLGRSIAHNTIWFNKPFAIKRIHEKNKRVINIPDCYGILPLTYAALLGSQPLVLLLLELNANIKSGLKIADSTIEKFKPMLKNLEKLKKGISDPNTILNIDKVIDQVKRDFKVI